jgi:hypothetical protein
MKATLILAVFLIANFQTAFADTKMTTDVCLKLIMNTTSGVFYNEDNIELVKQADGVFNKKDSDLYFKNVVDKLDAKLIKECEDKRGNYTFEKFQKTYTETCGDACRESVSVLNTNIATEFARKDRVRNVCATLCNQGKDKLDFLKQGIDMAKADSPKSAPDCTGVVSDKGRGIEVKSIGIDLDTRKTTIKTTGK